ncbi:MAG: hypothetical protein IK089_02765 [Oxalobacter sp.]|nr:hypothetical protein [Oxalobacter sp.]
MSNPRYMHTLYCDDIRQEANGKAIYIGVYGNTMNITVDEAAFKENNGVVVPRLCLVTQLNSPASEPMKKIDFSINLDGEAVSQFSAEMPPLPEDQSIRYQTCNIVNTISLTLRTSSRLSVTAKIGDQEIEGPGLAIRLALRRPAVQEQAASQAEVAPEEKAAS